MEQLIRNLFGDWGILIIPLITGVITSFPIEALNLYRPTEDEKYTGKSKFLQYVFLKPKMTNAVITLIFTAIVMWAFKSYYTNGADILIFLVINFSTAIIFYNVGGKRVVKIVVEWFIKKFSDKLDKTNL